MKSEFAAKQPKHGDKVIHCGHLDCDEHYFWYWPKAAKFQRPDGTIVEADWLIACERCFQRTEGHALKIPVRGDATWQGDEPFVCKPDVQ